MNPMDMKFVQCEQSEIERPRSGWGMSRRTIEDFLHSGARAAKCEFSSRKEAINAYNTLWKRIKSDGLRDKVKCRCLDTTVFLGKVGDSNE